MSRNEIAPLTAWITRAALDHPQDLPTHLMQQQGIGRRRAGRLLRQLETLHWLSSEGPPRKRRYKPGALRQVVQRYALDGLQEDQPWRRDFAPCFDLPPGVARITQHVFTELLNNAVDHSGGTQATVSMRQTALQVQLLVSDDGVGLFDRIAGSFAIDEPQLAMLELSKGKLTSAPQHHSGHGLFFGARLADVFDIHANHNAFQRRAWEPHRWCAGRASAASARAGTSVYVGIALDTTRTLDEVLQAHSASGSGYDFSRTRVPLHLAADGGGSLLSRAQARRATLHLGRFRHIELDFSGIEHVGHAFADELLRVFRAQHADIDLVPLGMTPRVQTMLASVTG